MGGRGCGELDTGPGRVATVDGIQADVASSASRCPNCARAGGRAGFDGGLSPGRGKRAAGLVAQCMAGPSGHHVRYRGSLRRARFVMVHRD